MKTLGFIGTGGMGSGMAANLIKAGYSLVVNDLRREQTRALESQGAEFKESPRAVAESCEMVLSMLPYNDAFRTVGLGGGGLHEASGGAKLWIDFSSIDKKTIVAVHAALLKKAGLFLTAQPAVSKKQQQRERCRYGFRDRKNCLINISRCLRQWARRFSMSASLATPSW